LLRYRQVWAIAWRDFWTDPIWWLYISWLPKYLADARGFSLSRLAFSPGCLMFAADAGSLPEAGCPVFLISRGWSVDRSRKLVILIATLLMPAGIFAAFAHDAMVALVLIGVVALRISGLDQQRADLTQRFLLRQSCASVAGLGGTGAGVGSMIFYFQYRLGRWTTSHTYRC